MVVSSLEGVSNAVVVDDVVVDGLLLDTVVVDAAVVVVVVVEAVVVVAVASEVIRDKNSNMLSSTYFVRAFLVYI